MHPARKMTTIICSAANIFVATPQAAELSFRDASVESDAADDPRREWLDRVEDARKSYEAFAASVRLAARDSNDAAPLRESHLDDWTLRAGDIVVTETGLLLFKGSQALPHETCDFERVGERRARSLPHRSALLEILRATARRGR